MPDSCGVLSDVSKPSAGRMGTAPFWHIVVSRDKTCRPLPAKDSPALCLPQLREPPPAPGHKATGGTSSGFTQLVGCLLGSYTWCFMSGVTGLGVMDFRV